MINSKNLGSLIIAFLVPLLITAQQVNLVNGNLKVFVNDIELLLEVDTGAETTYITNPSKFGGLEYFKKYQSEEVNVILAFDKSKERAYTLEKINSPLGIETSPKVIVRETVNKGLQCDKVKKKDGLLGVSYLKSISENKVLHFDYGKGIIELVDSIKKSDIVGYSIVNSRFENNSIFIELTVANQMISAIFDTGADSFLILNKQTFKRNDYDYDTFKSPLLNANNGFSSKKTRFYKDLPMKLGSFEIDDNIVTINKSLNSNYIGKAFIKNFNWIVDFTNERIYAKQINKIADTKWLDKLVKIDALVAAVNDKLIVIYSKNKKYKFLTSVKSIDGKAITLDNLCEMQNLLIKNAQDLSRFDIQF